MPPTAGDEVARKVDPSSALGLIHKRLEASLSTYIKKDLGKLLETEELRIPIDQFLTNESTSVLCVYFGSGNTLMTSTYVPSETNTRRKGIIFFKLNPQPIDAKAFHDSVYGMEFVVNPLEGLSTLTQRIFYPLLRNKDNQVNMSAPARMDILMKFNAFMSDLYIVLGQSEGKTLLPVPPEEVYDESFDLQQRNHLLETYLIGWIRQIKQAAIKEPDDVQDPMTEISFWKNKSDDLKAIKEQIVEQPVRRGITALQEAQSLIVGEFGKLEKELELKSYEADSNFCFLKTLEPYFLSIRDSLELDGLLPKFRPLMHTILMVWKHSDSYNTPTRLSNLMKCLSNSMVAQASKFVSGEEIFKFIDEDNVDDALDKIQLTRGVLAKFKETFQEYQEKANKEIDDPHQSWKNVSVEVMFSRFDEFQDRCRDVIEFTSLVSQFQKLEKIFIGGAKGRRLTDQIRQISKSFNQYKNTFKSVKYDIMDLSARQFDDDFYKFRHNVKELERRLASILSTSFEDLPTLEAQFKLLDGFEDLLQRPIIADEFSKKLNSLLHIFLENLRDIQLQFSQQVENPDIKRNFPPCAGALMWCQGFRRRGAPLMQNLRRIVKITEGRSTPVDELAVTSPGDKLQEIESIWDALERKMDTFEKKHIEQWIGSIENISSVNLKKQILIRCDKTEVLTVNFDKAMVRLLRECKFLICEFNVPIPENALSLYAKAETYQKQICQLQLIASMYNSIKTCLHPEELPLLQRKLEEIDSMLMPGITEISWKRTKDVDRFMGDVLQEVQNANQVFTVLKTNLETAKVLLQEFGRQPFAERKMKAMLADEFREGFEKFFKGRLTVLEDINKQIHELIGSVHSKLDISRGDPKWKTYVQYAQTHIERELALIVQSILKWFIEQVDEKKAAEQTPMIEIQLALFSSGIVSFTTSGDATRSKKSDSENHSGKRLDVWDELRNLGYMIFQVGKTVRKIENPKEDYQEELKVHKETKELLAIFNRMLDENKEHAAKVKSEYDEFKGLYEQDRTKFFKKFLQKDGILSHDNDEEQNQDESDSFTELPNLDAFAKHIAYYRDQQIKIASKKTPRQVGWLKIDAQPLKQALSTWASKWSYTFTVYLTSKVTEKVDNLSGFMDNVRLELEKLPKKGDLDHLKRILKVIHLVRTRQSSTVSMFKPLNEIIKFLQIRDVPVSQDHIKMLEDIPLQWESLVDKVFKTKEKVNPLQDDEVDSIKRKVWDFAEVMMDFREEFRANAPFHWRTDTRSCYAQLQFWKKQIEQKNMEASKLNQLEDLFELNRSKYRQIQDCGHEITLLKQLWDMVSLTLNVFSSWRREKWDKIDTEGLLVKVNRLNKQINSMDKEIRGWKAFQGLQEEVKNYQTVLPLVSLLHSDTMKDRHWKNLMEVTKTQFTMGADFCLGDMLDLGLHNSVDEVEEVVEISDKEAKIESQLKKLKNMWEGPDGQQIEYGVHDEGVAYPKIPEELMVNLEEAMSVLQSMKGQGKYVEFFLTEVNAWEQNMGVTETVINDWLIVSSKWSSLQAIFIGSEDIRVQLPEDSKRFDMIDGKWRALMNSATSQTNAVEACCWDGRCFLLENLKADLGRCEKSLNQYLETKKMSFPRFYFLSNTALLDLLSNGNNPQFVMKHLPSCFNNIQKLEFKKDDEGNFTNCAVGMYSQSGGEYVPFGIPLTCEGAVEDWLNKLVVKMKDCLRKIIIKAKGTADQWDIEKPRIEWLYDYCAQVVLTASQLIWTEEVELSFDSLVDGNETAMKDFYKVCSTRLADMIKLVMGKLSKRDRTKIMTLITVDVHNRDVVQMLIDNKIQEPTEFSWQSQMRYRMTKDNLVQVLVADWVFNYAYEYTGNTGRLVITPLTDRCYITLTQAMNLIMGGAPAGPAGTGKTETVKDLGRACAVPVYVFNCSEQMNVMSLGNIFKGLCQTGGWGCFDEFNRIPIEVLSVVATQVGSIMNALREKRPEFDLLGVTIKLKDTVGVFITMNPGYAGRCELPENLKALFRSCAMVVPDMELICENMLMSEGFLSARPLAHKFITLYGLSKELLSQQKHYDWGLRATKAVLRVAGGLKRAEPKVHETLILMRALRDFNIPKIVSQDQPIFLRLIDDLFPGLEIERKVDPKIQTAIERMSKKLQFQAEEQFCRKVTELHELLEVRHSVFIIGSDGVGKTAVWSVLAAAYNELGQKCVFEVMNPKAVKNDELYGWLSATTGDWYDGILSTLMRNMSQCEGGYTNQHEWKWIICDSDIDPEWIESLNTVMDDNKVLTLVSNERIPVTDSMRLVFEVAHLNNATPATVSRAGILNINRGDIGIQPFINSWIDKRDNEDERSMLQSLFNKYITQESVTLIRKKFQNLVPISDLQKVQALCYILEGTLHQIRDAAVKVDGDTGKQILERHFVFSIFWAFGGCMLNDVTRNCQKEFSDWAKTQYQCISFPYDQDVEGSNLVFDWFFDIETNEVVRWESKVIPYKPAQMSDTVLMVNNIVVDTADTTRLTYYANKLVDHGNPIMFVGTSGTGKTSVCRGFLKKLNEDKYCFAAINLNSFTDATQLRKIIQQYIDKRSGRTYGPPNGKKLVYYIDDLNMPYVDAYGTQSPIALIRQEMDYHLIYDCDESDPNRKKKLIRDCQYISSMNHKAGSFTVNPRLMSHFLVLATSIVKGDMRQIFSTILRSHLDLFDPKIQALCDPCVNATIDLLFAIQKSPKFRPTTAKFHYQFTIRDMAAVFQGLVLSQPCTLQPIDFIRLWLHESCRVFGDRLINQKDLDACSTLIEEFGKKNFECDADAFLAKPCIYTAFVPDMKGKNSNFYTPVESYEQLNKELEAQLLDYNENNAVMPLVLFDMAMDHVVRVTRIIKNPQGSALLVGVGGSGKQSLSRLASFICNYEVFQIQITRTYGEAELLEDIQKLYMKAGCKGQGVTFMITDSNIKEERWLVHVNDILSSGEIPKLFEEEQKESIYSSLRNVAKKTGINPDDKKALSKLFIERVRSNLHIVLCFSPVGDTFRIRARKFPALVNCTALDWFFPWPRDALCNVADRFLDVDELDLGSPEQRQNIAHHMAEVHISVNTASVKYRERERRYNYTTPKSFLELISFYKICFKNKSDGLYKKTQRLEKGIATLQKTSKDVAALKEDLLRKLEIVEEKKAEADKLIKKCGNERLKVDEQKGKAQEEAAAANAEKDKAQKIQDSCQVQLAKAMPALERAKEAVACLTRSALTELKAMATPDPRVLDVTAAVQILKDGEMSSNNHTWKKGKKMMGDVGRFLKELEVYDAKSIPEDRLTRVKSIMNKEHFTPEIMIRVSSAAANLCAWVCASVTYNEVYKEVAPKMALASEASKKAESAMARLAQVNAEVAQLEETLQKVEASLQSAFAEKDAVEEDAQKCKDRLNLAERLVGGLADENERWGLGVEALAEETRTLVGDVLLQAAFVSYIGAFNQAFRNDLWEDCWVKDLVEKQIPLSEEIRKKEKSACNVLSTEPEQAKWANEGLPVDNISIENAAIVTLCERWPLLIDPQLQGLKWLKKREKNLKVITMGQGRWLSVLLQAISNGDTVLIENCPENIDPTIEPVLSRAIIKKGRSMKIKFAGEEIDYDPKFQLYIQCTMLNPHYQPEIFAQCTVINFIVTECGLEEQLLALVVNEEKPELEEQKVGLMRLINDNMVSLNDLENELLFKLSNAPDDILSDVSLINGLENTKKAAIVIQKKVAQAKEQEILINNARNEYRPVAQEASWIYFLLIQLNAIDHMYQYSLNTFVSYFYKAMRCAEKSDVVNVRVKFLSNMIRIVIFTWVSRGLFESHKLIFSSQLTFKLLTNKAIPGELNSEYFDFMIRGTRKYGDENQIAWLPDASWYSLCALMELPGLERLLKDVIASPNRFKEWYLKAEPEKESLPLDWRKIDTENPFAKVLIVKALRPDRTTIAVEDFVVKSLPSGKDFIELDAGSSFASILKQSLDDSNKTTPVFFILSSGADPISTVYEIAQKNGYLEEGRYHRVALGQGQDIVAMKKLAQGHKDGGWVVLENIHLMPKWCRELEKQLTEYAVEGSHDSFRLFLTAEPSKNIPIGLLENSIKLTNEPPQGLKANLKRAFASFNKDEFDFRESNVKTLQFALCWFHAVLIERKKFGPLGWNANYPFNTGDLVNSGTIMVNKLESSNNKIPWADLRYIFGEIMYGGHITDDLDRLLCMTYLQFYMRVDLFDEFDLVPFLIDNDKWSFHTPSAMSYDEYFKYIDDCLPADNPIMYGLHPNTEITVRTNEANNLCEALLSLQPKDAASAGSGQNPTQRVASVLEEILEKVDDVNFDLEEVLSNLAVDERGPYQYVFLQECERMGRLVDEMKRSLKELDLGLSGDLTMSERMETLQESLFMNKVPDSWSYLAYPCLRAMGSWIANLVERAAQNMAWADNPTQLPLVVNVSYFFNPQSFLTAVMQITSRRNNLELDKLAVITEVTRKKTSEIDCHAREGSYVCGFNLEGASWNAAGGVLVEAIPRRMICPMPVVNVKAILAAKLEKKGIYPCPVYQTQQRGPTYVFTAPLRTKSPPAKWVLGGVVLVMDYVV